MAHVHVAVVDGRAARRLERGEQRVVHRLLGRAGPPLGCVTRGDHVHFKTRGGVLIGSARVGRVRELRDLGVREVARLRRVYRSLVIAPEDFRSCGGRKRHAVLIWLGPLRPPAADLRVPGPSRAKWAVLGRA